jgi:hypothetical protein
MGCIDWELSQLYRKCVRSRGRGWDVPFRKRCEELITKKDLHFFVGNLHQYPNSWMVVGLFYPPPQTQGELF